ncbi:MAG: DUF945 family protein [Gammaproteobacteria bacterium]|nr:DUF945 family protein [Gammaproteobacteria bacterium]
MRKTAAVVVAVLIGVAVVAGSASYWLGMRARQSYAALLQQVAQNSGFGVSYLHFQNGWLASTATATLTPPGFPADISVTSRIRPGPFPELAHLGFMPGMASVTTQIRVISKALVNFQPITAHTMIYLAGNSVTRLSIPAFRRGAPGAKGFGWLPANGEIIATAGSKTVTGIINFPEAQIFNPRSSVTLSQATFRWARPPGTSDSGQASLSAQRISKTGASSQFAIDGLRITLWHQRRLSNVAARIKIQVQMVNDGISSYGPGQILLRIDNLDGVSLDAFGRAVRVLAARRLPPDRLGAVMLARTSGLLRAQARKKPKFTIASLAFKAVGSNVVGKGGFVLDGTDIDGPDYSALLLRAMNGSFELLVPRAVVANVATDEIHHQLDRYKAQGILTPAEAGKLTNQRVADIIRNALPMYMNRIAARWHLVSAGADYMLTAAIHGGHLTINGQPAEMGESAHGP